MTKVVYLSPSEFERRVTLKKATQEKYPFLLDHVSREKIYGTNVKKKIDCWELLGRREDFVEMLVQPYGMITYHLFTGK